MTTSHIKAVELPEPPESSNPITWEMLCEISPELEIIKDDAKRLLTNPKDYYFWQRYEGLKRRMSSCVGMYAHPGLAEWIRSASAYDLAHKTIFGRYV